MVASFTSDAYSLKFRRYSRLRFVRALRYQIKWLVNTYPSFSLPLYAFYHIHVCCDD
ncbi:hypothetical protein Hdeb2414_s0016g00491771 [Helianthus debilis subsp. tardiflorus]